jgi:hypothetical protein
MGGVILQEVRCGLLDLDCGGVEPSVLRAKHTYQQLIQGMPSPISVFVEASGA